MYIAVTIFGDETRPPRDDDVLFILFYFANTRRRDTQYLKYILLKLLCIVKKVTLIRTSYIAREENPYP